MEVSPVTPRVGIPPLKFINSSTDGSRTQRLPLPKKGCLLEFNENILTERSPYNPPSFLEFKLNSLIGFSKPQKTKDPALDSTNLDEIKDYFEQKVNELRKNNLDTQSKLQHQKTKAKEYKYMLQETEIKARQAEEYFKEVLRKTQKPELEHKRNSEEKSAEHNDITNNLAQLKHENKQLKYSELELKQIVEHLEKQLGSVLKQNERILTEKSRILESCRELNDELTAKKAKIQELKVLNKESPESNALAEAKQALRLMTSERDYYKSQTQKLETEFSQKSPVAPEKSLFAELGSIDIDQADTQDLTSEAASKEWLPDSQQITSLTSEKLFLESELHLLKLEYSNKLFLLESEVSCLQREIQQSEKRIRSLRIGRKFYKDERDMYRSQVQNFIKKKKPLIKRIFRLK